MNYKIYNSDKLTLLGQDAVTILIQIILHKGIIEIFSNFLANLDYKESTAATIGFAKKFDYQTDPQYVLYHLVMFGGTFMKHNCHQYIIRKKLFGGYEIDTISAMSFIKGLESGLVHFKQKMSQLESIHATEKNGSIEYSYGALLHTLPIPYFYLDFLDKSLVDIELEFGRNISYIREPKNPKIPSAVFALKSSELTDECQLLLEGLFLK